jgi:hypothetical protein
LSDTVNDGIGALKFALRPGFAADMDDFSSRQASYVFATG